MDAAFGLKALFVFVLIASLDFVWARYTQAINEKKVLVACVTAALIYLLSGVSVISYVADPWLLLPAMVGACVGTAAALKWEKK